MAVDRSVLSETVVGDGTSVDNFIQIAHNCELGRGNVLVAYVGLSGSTKTGDGCVFGARAGTQEHVTLGKGVTVAGQTDVTKSLPDGAVVKGYPPRPLKEQLKIQVLQGKLPDFARRLKLLEEQILKK